MSRLLQQSHLKLVKIDSIIKNFSQALQKTNRFLLKFQEFIRADRQYFDFSMIKCWLGTNVYGSADKLIAYKQM